MKLAEALNRRTKVRRKLFELKIRLDRNSQVQEDEKPFEETNKLLLEYESAFDELNALVKRINKTNNSVQLEPDRTLMEALADRDCLAWRRAVLEKFKSAVVMPQKRYSLSEVKFVASVDVIQIQKKIDELDKKHQELVCRIQQMNWQADLVE